MAPAALSPAAAQMPPAPLPPPSGFNGQDAFTSSPVSASAAGLRSLPDPQRLLQALELCGGSRTRAAALLGIDRSTLWRRLRKYGLS